MINIQKSVLIWTILNFSILAFILNKFLFKPILKVMDERRAKIENYSKEKTELEEQFRIKSAQVEADRIQAQKDAIARGNEMLEREKEKTDEMIDEAREEYDLLLGQERLKVEQETAEIENSLQEKVTELAYKFAKTLLS